MNMQILVGGDLYTNCYLIWGEDSDTCALIDPGFDPEKIMERVRATGKKLEAILLTHTHFDHVFGVKELVNMTGCKVYVHKEELQINHQYPSGDICATDYYGEGDRVEVAGLSLQVLHTPGHTAGCVCLLTGDVMFSGDTLFAGSCGRTDLASGNPVQMRQSLNRLAALEGNYKVFPGHGESTQLNFERRMNPYMFSL